MVTSADPPSSSHDTNNFEGKNLRFCCTSMINMKVLWGLLALAAVGQCALLGSLKCTYGPSYWCSHIHHAKECNTLQHCMDTAWKAQPLGMTGATETCFDVIKVIEAVRRSKDVTSDLLYKMAKACTRMPLDKHSVCKDLLTHEEKEVYLLLKSDLPSMNIAVALGLCGGEVDTVPQPAVESGQVLADKCTDCKNFFRDVKEIVNKTEEKCIDKLKSDLCTRLGPFESLCNDTVDANGAVILNIIEHELRPDQLCAILQMCTNQTLPPPTDTVEYIRNKVPGNYCTDCKNFFGDIQQIVNSTEEKVAEGLKSKVCTRLGSFESLCNYTVDVYGTMVLNFIIQQLNPDDLCFLLQMCSDLTHAELVKSADHIKAKQQTQAMECDLCKNLTKDVQNALRDPTLQNNVMSALETDVCLLLPGDLATQCKSLVSEYGPIVFQILIAELDPTNVCQALGLCNATERQTDRDSKQTRVSLGGSLSSMRVLAPTHKEKVHLGPVCALCEYILHELEGMINLNSTEAEIIEALDEVCSLLPSTLESECKSFIEAYTAEIVELLVDGVLPKVVCTTLGLCLGDRSLPANVAMPVTDGSVCVYCEMAVAYIRSFLNNPDNAKPIEEFLDEVCIVLPASYRTLCGELISTYYPAFINKLNQYDDPVKVCSELSLCKSTNPDTLAESDSRDHALRFQPMAELQAAKPHLVGGDECMQGPAFWCASVLNARRCGVMDLCMEHYNMKGEA